MLSAYYLTSVNILQHCSVAWNPSLNPAVTYLYNNTEQFSICLAWADPWGLGNPCNNFAPCHSAQNVCSSTPRFPGHGKPEEDGCKCRGRRHLPSDTASSVQQPELLELMYFDGYIVQSVFQLNFCPVVIINRNWQKITHLMATGFC